MRRPASIRTRSPTESVIVVDRLEAVEIDDADSKAGAVALGLGEKARKLREEATPVGKLSQGVAIGESEILIRQGLRRSLLRKQRLAAGNESGKVAIIDEQHRDHCARDQQLVDRDRAQCMLARSYEESHEGNEHHQRNHQCRRAQMHQAEDDADDGDRHVEGDLALRERIAIGKQRKRPADEQRPDRAGNSVRDPQIAQDVRVITDAAALAQPPDHPGPGQRDQ
jgi:hypothetical protein